MNTADNNSVFGNAIQINNSPTNIKCEIKVNDYYQTEISLICEDQKSISFLRELENDIRFVVVKSNDNSYYSLYDLSFKSNTHSNRMYKLSLLTTNCIIGHSPLNVEENFDNISFKITEGFEIIGISPYDTCSIVESEVDLDKILTINANPEPLQYNTNIGKLNFVITPKRSFGTRDIKISLEHSIEFLPYKPLSLIELREIINKITSLFTILTGELITVNELSVFLKGDNGYLDEYSFVGFCNFPIKNLRNLTSNRLDTRGFLRLSLFKVSDFANFDKALNWWFENYSKIEVVHSAYERILLDEDAKIVSVNKFLAAMQLVEGFSDCFLLDESKEMSFLKSKKKLLSIINDVQLKEFVEDNLRPNGDTFRTSLKKFLKNNLRIIISMSDKEFRKYDKFIEHIVSDRNFYTHSSQILSKELSFTQIFDTAAIIKHLYRIGILDLIGLDREIIRKRLARNRSFEAYLWRLFEKKINAGFEVDGFDKMTWHFKNNY